MDVSSVAAFLTGYLIGSVDFGVMVPRLLGTDIYTAGSGNPGSSNVLRTMGKKVAAVVVVGDIGKGVAAGAIGDLAVGPAAGFAAGLAAVLGHCWPVWHRFRGGKGVATAAGMTLWLDPLLGVAMIAVWALLVGVTRRASVASLVLIGLYLPALAVLGHRGWSLLWAGAAAAVILLRHRGNIARLMSGAERTVDGSTP